KSQVAPAPQRGSVHLLAAWSRQLIVQLSPTAHSAPLQAAALHEPPFRQVVASGEQPVQLEESNTQASVHKRLPVPPVKPASVQVASGTSLPSQSSPASVMSLPQTEH